MFQIGKYLRILTILIQLFNWSFGKYNRLQLEGNLFNLKSNLSVFIKNSSGIIFYAIDSDYKFLIETKATKIMQQVSVKYKNVNSKFMMESTHSCERTIYGDVYLQFYINLQQSQFIIGCNKKVSNLTFERNDKIEYLEYYPGQRKELSKIINIWLGNIGSYIGSGSRVYNSMTTQLLGCVDKLNFNQKNIIIEVKGFLFLWNCTIKYIKKIWGISHSTNEEILYKMYDCNITSLNGRYCNNNIDFQNFSFKNSSYMRTTFKQTKFILRLDWRNSKPSSNIGYCLMEIVLKDNSSILFYVNGNNVLIENRKLSDLPNYEHVFSLNLSSNANNILLIHNDKLTLTMKIYDGEIIQIYSHSIPSEMKSVNIGHFKHTNFTPLFVTNIRFQYNETIWTNSLYIIDKSTADLESINLKLLFSSIIAVLILILIFVIIISFVLIRFTKGKKSYVDENINRSKTPSPNHYEYGWIETNVDGNINVEIPVNEQMQNGNNSNDIYEKLN